MNRHPGDLSVPTGSLARIVVVDTGQGDGRDLSVEKDNFPVNFELRQFTFKGVSAKLIEACAQADAVLTDYTQFDRKVLEKIIRFDLLRQECFFK